MITRVITYRNDTVPHRQPRPRALITLAVINKTLRGRTETKRYAVDLHLQPDWHRALGQYVEVRLHGKTLRTGVVDAVMPDGSILWISPEGPHPREMIERAHGKQVFARYQWDIPPLIAQPKPNQQPQQTDDSTIDP
ncbi:hypothetical protein HWD94_02225 [Pseudarthrobacter equi]|uniref:hypothetical protein n=1 Tax=Pseudarthrobacter equi TaxID=728066 RepID=UPI0021BFA451|nr:hypothetical protein [Pseudarthrobacter equi]MCT9623938.1 hypothetical protein [Pseudarthrobacter equi]